MSQPQEPDGNAEHEALHGAGMSSPRQHPQKEERKRPAIGTTVFVKVGAISCSTLFLIGWLLTQHPSITFGFISAGLVSGEFVTFLMPLFGLLALTFIVGWAIQASQ